MQQILYINPHFKRDKILHLLSSSIGIIDKVDNVNLDNQSPSPDTDGIDEIEMDNGVMACIQMLGSWLLFTEHLVGKTAAKP